MAEDWAATAYLTVTEPPGKDAPASADVLVPLAGFVWGYRRGGAEQPTERLPPVPATRESGMSSLHYSPTTHAWCQRFSSRPSCGIRLLSDGGRLVAGQREPTGRQLAQFIRPLGGCPPRAIGIVRPQRFPDLDDDEVPRVVEISHDLSRSKPRAGPGIGQDRGDTRLDIGRGIGAELDVKHGSDGLT